MKSAKELIAEMRAAGESQSSIARGTQISQATISRIENEQSYGTSSTYWSRISSYHAHFFAERAAAPTEHAST